MDKFNTTLDLYRKFIDLKFKPEAASELRSYLNNLNEKISAEGLANTRFIKMIEAFTVFFAKTVSLKNNHSVVEKEDLYKALHFIEFYSTERLWSELAEGRTFRNLKKMEWNFLEKLRECCNLEISFNAKNAFEDIIKRFTLHAAQIFGENERSAREKFMLLIRYTIIILSLLLSLSKGEGHITPDTVIKSYELFRIIFFRLPVFEFDVLFSAKNFIRKEIIIRLLEYMEKASQNSLTEPLVERIIENIGLRSVIDDNPIFYSEVKSLIQLIYLFIQYSRDSTRVEENDYRMILNVYNRIAEMVFGEGNPQLIRSLYEGLSNKDLSIDARIFVNNIENIIIGFSSELSISSNVLNLLPELSRKITLALSAISKMFAFKNKKLESDIEDLKKSVNVISNIFFNIKRG